MYPLMFFSVLISVFTVNKSLEINPKLLVNFAKHFNLNYGIIFYCEPLSTDVWTKVIKNEFLYFSFYDVSSLRFNLSESEMMMRFNYRQILIAFDITCIETNKVFKEFSRSSYFTASYNWLLLSDNYESSTELLQVQNINLDAEITLVVMKDDENAADLFDVYNPSYRSNGNVVVTAKGSYNENNGLNITMSGSKFDRRSNLDAIVIHTGVVASKVEKNRTLQQYMESKGI